MVTPGALTAASIVAQAFTGPGDRVLVESPDLPQRDRRAAARAARGWRRARSTRTAGTSTPSAATLRQTSPRLAYLIPDFQNPTGHLMTDAQREEYAAHLRRAHTVAVVDEAHQALALEGRRCRGRSRAYAPDTITIGSASKSFWGGLRLGWIRAPRGQMERLTQARVCLDLGAPVMEQLVLVRLLADADDDPRRQPRPPARAARRPRRRRRRRSCPSGDSTARPAASPCGASCPAPSAPPSSPRPSAAA